VIPITYRRPFMEENKTKILVIDDEEDVMYCLKNFLSRKGYITDGALNGEEALKKLSDNEDTDLILLDIIMPGLKGTEIARIVREKYPKIKIILVTAFPRESVLLKDNDLPVDAILTKPFRIHEICDKLQEIINQPETTEGQKNLDTEIDTRILFIKARILFVEPSIEVSEFLNNEFKELSLRGQYYDLHFATNETDLFNKIKLSEPDIIIFETSYLDKLNPSLPTKILLDYKKTCDVVSFDLASTVENNAALEKLYHRIRELCIKYGLVAIR